MLSSRKEGKNTSCFSTSCLTDDYENPMRLNRTQELVPYRSELEPEFLRDLVHYYV